MSPISYVLRAHDLRARQEEVLFEQEHPCPNSIQKSGRKEDWKLKYFLKTNRQATPVTPSPPSTKAID